MNEAGFEAQEIWEGGFSFTQVGVGVIAVAYRSPTSAGKFHEYWAMKPGKRLSSATINDPMSAVTLRTTDTYPPPMTSPNDIPNFKVWAIGLLGGSPDFYQHDGKSIQRVRRAAERLLRPRRPGGRR